jgi:hypothetical protein
MAAAQAFLDRGYPEENLLVFFAEDLGAAYVCQFNTKKYLETMDPADAMGPGLGPIGVPKDGAQAWMLRSGLPFAQQVAEHGAA